MKRFLKIWWPLLLVELFGGWMTYKQSHDPPGYWAWEFAVRQDTSFYEVQVPNGKKIKKIEIE